MNKSKVILASVGGVVAVATLALAYLIWDALSEKAEVAEELEAARAAAERLARLPVYPSPAGVKDTQANREAFGVWTAEAKKIASAGDLPSEKTTPPAFKNLLLAEAQRLSALPGAAEGKLVKPAFPFGFKDYIVGGVLPAERDLMRLQREWKDIVQVVEILADSGVREILDIRVAAGAAAAAEEESSARKGKKAKRAKKNRTETPASANGPAVTRFEVDFLTQPSAFVKAVNAFATNPRFIAVEGFSFQRERDALQEALGGDEKKADAQGSRRRRRQAQQEAPKAEEKTGLVTDPAKAPPLKVTVRFSVYDFRTLDATAEEANAEEEK